MSLTNYRALAREIAAYFKLETTEGEFVMPAAADVVPVLGMPGVTQSTKMIDSREIIDSRSRGERSANGLEAGNMSIECYCRPSGALGTAPQESTLLEAACGLKTVNAGASVIYGPATVKPSFSAVVKEGHMTHFVRGAKIGEVRGALNNNDYFNWNFSGQFKEAMRAGTSETIEGSTTTVLKMRAGEAALYDPGARVQVDDDDNTAAGYTISEVDTTADTITLSTALAEAPAAGAVVKGFVPTPTWSGYLIPGSEGVMTLDAAQFLPTNIELSINDNLSPDADEMNGEGLISCIDEGQRLVTASIQARLRRTHARFWTLARNQAQNAMLVTAGATAAKRCKISYPYAQFDSPTTDGDDLRRNMTFAVNGMPSPALDDEYSITFD